MRAPQARHFMNLKILDSPAVSFFLSLLTLSFALSADAQSATFGGPLDPAADPSRLVRPVHATLAEQYIWTAGDAAALRPDHAKFIYRDRDRKTELHAFRSAFTLRS